MTNVNDRHDQDSVAHHLLLPQRTTRVGGCDLWYPHSPHAALQYGDNGRHPRITVGEHHIRTRARTNFRLEARLDLLP